MIAREGLHIIVIGLVITAGLVVVATRYDSRSALVLSLVFGLLTVFSIFFFRDPVRKITASDGCLVAPADGRVIAVESIPDHPYIGGPAVKVSIFLSIFDVHVNRVPASGRIDYVSYNPGKFFAAFKDKASHLNEQTEIGMTASRGHKIIFKQIAGLIARRIVCRLEAGDEVSAGDRFGIIRFGSRAELIFPAESDVRVKLGQHVAGGKSQIGYLPPENDNPIEESNARGKNIQI
ncbi:MAG: phosphatidylserine decarboxylase family protein [Candidatus Zixiibacteriota bacterium]|nr:MAG: phosphatidylserine decarboxylase family protein [candidate division Zixibacteria bacterium]